MIMEIIMKAYKVLVKEKDGRLFSFAKTLPTSCKQYCIEYIPGKWVTAPIGGILLFDEEEKAKKFAPIATIDTPIDDHGRKLVIYKCEVKKGESVPLPPKEQSNSEKEIEECWNWHVGYFAWPKGTVAFRRVRLLEEINY